MNGETVYAVGVMNRMLSRTEEARDAWKTHAKKLEARVAKLDLALATVEDKLKVEKMHTAGLEAQLDGSAPGQPFASAKRADL